MTAALDPFAAARRRELTRLFALSGMLHAGLFALLSATWLPRHGALPAVISVDLVGAPRAAPAHAPAPVTPAPAPEPVPVAQPKPPPPPPPRPSKVVLPKEPLKKPAKQEKAPEKVKPEPKPRDKPEPPPSEDLDDVLADLREEAGEKRPEAEPVATDEPSAAPGPGAGALVSPEVAAWVRLAKIHVRRAWIVPPGFRTQTLVATLEVELDASGRVVGEPDVLQPSGNPWYDEGVVRALQKASPLPAPPEAGRWSFAFDSSEAL